MREIGEGTTGRESEKDTRLVPTGSCYTELHIGADVTMHGCVMQKINHLIRETPSAFALCHGMEALELHSDEMDVFRIPRLPTS